MENEKKQDYEMRRFLCMEEWENVSAYIWNGLEEKWPNFCFDDIDELGFILWENKKIRKRPSELEKEEMIEILVEFLKEHRSISVRNLLDADEIEEEVKKMNELGIYLYAEWDVNSGGVEIIREQDPHFYEDIFKSYNVLKEKYGIEDAAIELVFSFSKELGQNQLDKVEEIIVEKFEIFEEKTRSFFEKEVAKAKNILEAIINEGMFDKNGVLKQEVFKTQ